MAQVGQNFALCLVSGLGGFFGALQLRDDCDEGVFPVRPDDGVVAVLQTGSQQRLCGFHAFSFAEIRKDGSYGRSPPFGVMEWAACNRNRRSRTFFQHVCHPGQQLGTGASSARVRRRSSPPSSATTRS